jgi:hypothetical protein
MAVERHPGGTSLIDVLDRVLDKGIVVDAWVRISLVGIDLITVEARVVVASIDTYLKYAEAVGIASPTARPALGGAREDLSLPAGERLSGDATSRQRTSTRDTPRE